MQASRNAVIVGASSGIGWALAKTLTARGYRCGLTARRLDQLDALRHELGGQAVIRRIDVTDTSTTIAGCESLIEELGGVDLIVLASGIGEINPPLSWDLEAACIQTNVLGFAAVANVAIRYFEQQGRGQFVGISSIAALRGGKGAPAYNASKAFMSNYMEGLRRRVSRFNGSITVTDVRPGFVDTPMAKGEGKFWVASAKLAAEQIANAVEKRKAVVYVTRRWRLIAWLLKLVPEGLYRRL